MTHAEIQVIYSRAKQVTDGFKQPTTRLAHDIVALVKHMSMTQQKPSEKVSDDGDVVDFLKGIFK